MRKLSYFIFCCRYHSWMQNTELLRLTASQPLTLDEEYQMQQSWMMDDDSKVFIYISSI